MARQAVALDDSLATRSTLLSALLAQPRRDPRPARRWRPDALSRRRHDGHTFEPRGRPLLGHAGFILTEAFSPDGRTVATTSSDGTVRLWDVASRRPIGSPVPGIPNAQVGAVFTRGGTHLAAVYESGPGYSWDVGASSWAQRACAVAGRRLTRAEWAEALPGRCYEPACAPTER